MRDSHTHTTSNSHNVPDLCRTLAEAAEEEEDPRCQRRGVGRVCMFAAHSRPQESLLRGSLDASVAQCNLTVLPVFAEPLRDLHVESPKHAEPPHHSPCYFFPLGQLATMQPRILLCPFPPRVCSSFFGGRGWESNRAGRTAERSREGSPG
jgi:hypothetical protein